MAINPNDAKYAAIRRRALSPAGNTLLAVGAGAGTITWTFVRKEPDTSYIVSAVPSWNTTVYVLDTDKTTTTCKFTFGTVAPGGGGTLNVHVCRSEDLV